ncbi:M20 metallopeptidase family protein [Actinomyces minihominis]|uniref:M20 metallopeptidase family protein n=1 Tax=Actinomyces minihominis TaxID=2002838 RepID=UPI001A92913D|nr:M20 family metallopeptidase [Actinomyces minihominis]
MTAQKPMPDFVGEAKALQSDLVNLRRAIHEEPELGLDNPETQKRILEALEGLPLEITLGKGLSSVVAVLRGGREGPAVLLRGDTDALPLQEETGLPYASKFEKTAHACGHDMHTAGLVGAAKLLAAHQEDLPGDVVFMFQPGEEGFGGAEIMIDEGVLDAAGKQPIAAYAFHVGPGPRGVIATKDGTATASSNQMYATIRGRGGHGSQPHRAIDPVPVAAQAILSIQAFVTRMMNAFDPVVVSVTQVSTGGNAVNVIPEEVTLGATIRTLTDQSVDHLETGLKQLLEGVASGYGCEVDFEFRRIYPPTVNDSATTDMAVEDLRSVFGEKRVVVVNEPMMGSEDFAFVADKIPSTFAGFFTTPPEMDYDKAEFNHSPRAVFDDGVLNEQSAALAVLAYGRLLRAAQENED